MDDTEQQADQFADAPLADAATITGERIGPFRVARLLGSGGTGFVHLCSRDDGPAEHAIKSIRPEDDDPLEPAQQAYGPERIDLIHVNIVRSEHLPGDDGATRLVMPYVGDESGSMNLHRYLHERGDSLPSAAVGRLIRQLLNGLSHGHKLGQVHSNLKPSNVLVDVSAASPVVKIADFGLVGLFGERGFRRRVYAGVSQSVSFAGAALEDVESQSESESSFACGSEDHAETEPNAQALLESWAYMAPEQRMPDGESDCRADIYAAGLLAHRMLTGRLPDSPAGSPVRLRPRLSAWEAWINRCLLPDPAERFQSAREAHDALPEQTQANAGGRTATMLTVVAVAALLVIAAVVAVPLLSSLWYGDEQLHELGGEPAVETPHTPRNEPTPAPDDD